MHVIQLQHILSYQTYIITSSGSLAHSCQVRASPAPMNTAASKLHCWKPQGFPQPGRISPPQKDFETLCTRVRILPWAQTHKEALPLPLPQSLFSSWWLQLHTLLEVHSKATISNAGLGYNAIRLFACLCQGLNFAELWCVHQMTLATRHVLSAAQRFCCSFVPCGPSKPAQLSSQPLSLPRLWMTPVPTQPNWPLYTAFQHSWTAQKASPFKMTSLKLVLLICLKLIFCDRSCSY